MFPAFCFCSSQAASAICSLSEIEHSSNSACAATPQDHHCQQNAYAWCVHALILASHPLQPWRHYEVIPLSAPELMLAYSLHFETSALHTLARPPSAPEPVLADSLHFAKSALHTLAKTPLCDPEPLLAYSLHFATSVLYTL